MIMDAVEDRLAENPVKLDLRGKTLIADFFLVATGTSEPHLKAITESVLEKTEEERLPKPRIEGQEAGEWILMDYGDVVLHVMNAESRQRYRLEQFWSTPQPKGALPPTPSTVGGANGASLDDLEYGKMPDEDVDALDVDDEEEDDAAFFDDADQEVEPIDEEDIEFVESVRHKDTGDDDELPATSGGNGARA